VNYDLDTHGWEYGPCARGGILRRDSLELTIIRYPDLSYEVLWAKEYGAFVLNKGISYDLGRGIWEWSSCYRVGY